MLQLKAIKKTGYDTCTVSGKEINVRTSNDISKIIDALNIIQFLDFLSIRYIVTLLLAIHFAIYRVFNLNSVKSVSTLSKYMLMMF